MPITVSAFSVCALVQGDISGYESQPASKPLYVLVTICQTEPLFARSLPAVSLKSSFFSVTKIRRHHGAVPLLVTLSRAVISLH